MYSHPASILYTCTSIFYVVLKLYISACVCGDESITCWYNYGTKYPVDISTLDTMNEHTLATCIRRLKAETFLYGFQRFMTYCMVVVFGGPLQQDHKVTFSLYTLNFSIYIYSLLSA